MRLTCPNCGAQYEVDPGMIPDEGRDVQCSNCGQTWFQMPEGQMSVPEEAPVAEETAETEAQITDEPAETEAPAPDDHETVEHAEDAQDGEPAEEPESAEAAEQAAEPAEDPEHQDDSGEPVPDVAEDVVDGEEDQPPPSPLEDALQAQREAIEAAGSEQEDDPETDAGDAPAGDEPPPEERSEDAPAADEPATDETEDEAPEASEEDPPRREVDAAVLGILREEAEREVAARRQERGEALETQTEMGLPEAADDETGLRAVEDEIGEQVEAPGSRSDLLPDVEEINSSLRPADQHEDGVGPDDPVAQEENKRRGFRSGFVAIVTVAAVLVLTYVFAPQIVRTVPAAEPVVILYLDLADGARAGLDSAMARSVEGLAGLLAKMGGEDGT